MTTSDVSPVLDNICPALKLASKLSGFFSTDVRDAFFADSLSPLSR
jgi:hypothetical protein